MPKISIVVPVYNAEEYLIDCLQSLSNQSMEDIEILAIDDGSTDSSLEILHQYQKREPRLQVFSQTNQGVSAARNFGIQQSTGDYITFVDSDDWIEKEMYQQMMSFGDSEVIMCDFILENKRSQELITADIRSGYYQKNEIIKELYPTLLVKEDLGRLPIVSACICLFKRELLQTKRVYFEVGLKYAEDYLFMATVMLQTKSYYYLKGFHYYHYRQYELSRSKKYQSEWWKYLLVLHIKLKELVFESPDFDFSRQLKLQLLHSVMFLSNSICKDENTNISQKVKLLDQLFNHPSLKTAFHQLDFSQQPLGLKIVFYFVKYKMSLVFLLYKKVFN